MKEVLNSPYRQLFLWGLLIHVLCAWFSCGVHHYDEHYQILEFANLKMGGTTSDLLPWEFQEKIRPTLQPWMAFAVMKSLQFIGVINPFAVTFILRLLIGLLAWLISCKMILLFIGKMKDRRAIRLFILMSFFLWFVPYINVRFSSENLSAILLLTGLYVILRWKTSVTSAFILSGLLLGLSFFVRFQMCFAIAGFSLWLIVIRRISFKHILAFGSAMLLSMFVCVLLDSLFYGEWIFTPWNYYYSNLVLDKAAGWGVFPWWYYLTQFAIKAIPPLSLALLIFFIVGVTKNLRNALVWTILPFLLAHMLVGHKEMRFLFPVCFIFIYIASLGLEYLLEKKVYLKIHKAIVVLSVVIVLPVGLYRTFAPADVATSYLEFLYHYQPTHTTNVLSIQDDVYKLSGLEANYYRPKHITPWAFSDTISMRDFVSHEQPDNFLFLNTRFPYTLNFDGYESVMVYCIYPDWVLKVNINHWQERTYIWSIYRFKRK